MRYLAVVFVLGVTSVMGLGAELVAPGAKVQKLAGDFRFTEGPAADAQGNVFFTDIPNNRIHKWTLDGILSTFREDSEGANGLAFAPDGMLYACQGGGRRLVQIGPHGTVSQVVATYQGKRFNSLNDLWLDPQGGIYFTDPRYGGGRDNMEQDGEHVYYLMSDRKTIIRVIDDMTRPNGIIGTPDGKTLYVADHGASQTFRYTIGENGRLTQKRLFTASGSDGLTLDEGGNVYLTTDAVVVYSPQGQRLQRIEIPERPSNVCFGGKERRTLFITARTSLYALAMRVRGAS